MFPQKCLKRFSCSKSSVNIRQFTAQHTFLPLLSPANPELLWPLTSAWLREAHVSSQVSPLTVTPGGPSSYKQSPKRGTDSSAWASEQSNLFQDKHVRLCESILPGCSCKVLASLEHFSFSSKCKLLHNGIRNSLSSVTVFLPGCEAESLLQQVCCDYNWQCVLCSHVHTVVLQCDKFGKMEIMQPAGPHTKYIPQYISNLLTFPGTILC